MKKFVTYLSVLLSLIFLFNYCSEKTVGPNEIGGETDLALTKVGNDFGIVVTLNGFSDPAFSSLEDTINITKNDKGIVTFHGKITGSKQTYAELDTMFGTQTLPDTTKRKILSLYLSKYNIILDTSDKDNFNLTFDFTAKFTSEGIQDFHYSNGDYNKPFTIVKYNSNIGDKYEYISTTGDTITRTVIEKNPVEDWSLGYLIVKSIKVEEVVKNDPILDKIIFIANHKYGLVGYQFKLKNNRNIVTTIFPWSVLKK